MANYSLQIELIVVYLYDEDDKDEEFACHVSGYEPVKDVCPEHGDLITVDDAPAVILGWGESSEDAINSARAYYQRLLKWHGAKGDTNGEQKVEFFGRDLAESQLLNPAYQETDSTESTESTDPSSEPIPKKRRI